MTTTSPPEQGQLVQVRSRPWVVNEVKPSSLPTPAMKLPAGTPQNLLTLFSVEDDGLGEELQVVWEIEPGAKVVEKVALPEPTGFDAPEKLDAFLDAVRWGAASTADVKNIQSPFRSGIEIEDYQLDPVVRAIQMPRVNLLIADDVGLGKTIEAGMVALELILRHRARKILIVVPSALQIQWRDQMRDKFGLDFRIVDSSPMRDLRRRRGIHVNPWSHFPRLIMPTSYHIRLDKEHHVFSAAHFITFAGNDCERLHGHNYRMACEVHGELDENQYVVDFIAVRDELRKVLEELEHRMLLPANHPLIRVAADAKEVTATFLPDSRRWVFPAGDCVILPVANTTAELLAHWIGQRLLAALEERTGSRPERVQIGVDENNGQWGVCELAGE